MDNGHIVLVFCPMRIVLFILNGQTAHNRVCLTIDLKQPAIVRTWYILYTINSRKINSRKIGLK